MPSCRLSMSSSWTLFGNHRSPLGEYHQHSYVTFFTNCPQAPSRVSRWSYPQNDTGRSLLIHSLVHVTPYANLSTIQVMKHTPDEELAALTAEYRAAVDAMEQQKLRAMLYLGSSRRTAEKKFRARRDTVFSLRIRLWDLAGVKPPTRSGELKLPPWNCPPRSA